MQRQIKIVDTGEVFVWLTYEGQHWSGRPSGYYLTATPYEIAVDARGDMPALLATFPARSASRLVQPAQRFGTGTHKMLAAMPALRTLADELLLKVRADSGPGAELVQQEAGNF